MGVNTKKRQCHLGQGLECSGSPSMLAVWFEGRETLPEHPEVRTYELSLTQTLQRNKPAQPELRVRKDRLKARTHSRKGQVDPGSLGWRKGHGKRD